MALILRDRRTQKARELDKTPDVVDFKKLEDSPLRLSGVMTGDLLLVASPNPSNRKVYTEEFIDEVEKRLKKKLAFG